MRLHHVASLSLVACAGTTEPAEVRSDLDRDLTPDVSPTELTQLVAGNTEFAADLYRQVRTTEGNLFMSPHSISTALAMTYAGARETTATQMAGALHYTLPATQLHAAFNALDLELASRAEASDEDAAIPFRLRTANSIWSQDGYAFQAAFLDDLAINYGAGLRILDFKGDPEGSRGVINGWVEDQTNDRIKDLLPEGSITDFTRLVLTNAIYFSAAWNEPFKPEDTANRAFQTAAGSVDVPMLHGLHELDYGASDAFEVAELPYDGEQLSMVVVVPRGDLTTFEAALDGTMLHEIFGSLKPHLVDLTLPKFKFDASLGLADTLRALGMTDAFDPALANLSGIDGTRNLFISDVLHKGFVSIDENGTEAAAATAVIIGETSVPEPATLMVDRPFLFLIRDRPTGAILFIGRVVDPR